MIPPNTNFEKLNPQIDAEFLNLRFPTECIPWPTSPGSGIRRASINSFGFGGSNAHVVLEATEGYLQTIGYVGQLHHRVLALPHVRSTHANEANGHFYNGINGTSEEINGTNGHHNETMIRAQSNGQGESAMPAGHAHVNGSPSQPTVTPRLVILTSSDEDGVARQAAALSSSPLSTHSNSHLPLDDVIYTLNMHRTMHDWKSFAVLLDADATTALATLPSSLSKPFKAASPPNLGLVFTGQGAQWSRMGLELLQWPVFRASLQKSQKYLRMFGCEWPLLGEYIPLPLPLFQHAGLRD